MNTRTLLAAAFTLLCARGVAQEKPETIVKTEVKEVTVFIKGAQVTRQHTVDIAEGKTTLKLVGLSPYTDPKSVNVKVSGNVTVLSVDYQQNFTDTIKYNRESEQIADKIRILEDKIAVEKANLEIANEELNFIKNNSTIGGKNQEVSLNNLKDISGFYRERLTTLKMKVLETNKILQKLQNDKEAFTKQLMQLESSSRKSTGEVLVKVSSKAATKCNVELSYYVASAGWYPTYDIRAAKVGEPIELTYKANINQNSEEEWKNVKLKLSSSNPKLGGIAPKLMPYFLNYNLTPPSYKLTNNEVAGRVIDAETNTPIVGASVQIKGSTIGTSTNANGTFTLSTPNGNNELYVSFVGYEPKTVQADDARKNIYLTPMKKELEEIVVTAYGISRVGSNGAAAPKKMRIRGSSSMPTARTGSIVEVEQNQNQTSVEFDIKEPYTIPSSNKNTTVDIESYSLDASFKYYCVPKIDKDAFLMANITSWEKLNLLDGEANVFFENTYVGKTLLDIRNMSDTLQLSLGRDKSVQVKREKVKEQTTKHFFGSKKEDSRTWRITIKNNKQQPISLLLFEQIPVSTNDEIEVLPNNLSGGTLNKENGEVKWVFDIAPLEKKEVDLKYSVKYPKDKELYLE